MILYYISPLTTTISLDFGYIKCTPDVAFAVTLLDIVVYQYVRVRMNEETAAKNKNCFIVANF